MFKPERAYASHFAIILTVVFTAEVAIMFGLPFILPETAPWWVESLVDSFLLTLLIAPILWMLIVRPWRSLAKSRRDLLAFMMREQEEERRKIARDLHDEVGQSVTSILVGLRNVEQSPSQQVHAESVIVIRAIATQMLDDVRRLARGLRPVVLDDFGLCVALGRLAEDIHASSGIEIELHTSALKDRRFSHDVEIELYRIVQEALTNIVRHAQTKRARIKATTTNKSVGIVITDEGKGFDPTVEESPDTHLHIGLSSMRERTALLNGRFELQSRPGQGTSITVQVPLSELSDGQDSHPTGR